VWIDTHCHLDAPEFDADRDDVLQRARAAGVSMMVLPAVDRAGWATAAGLASRHGLAYALGIHPLAVREAGEHDVVALGELVRSVRGDPRLVAVGEIGLDHFVPGHDHDRQALFYERQLRLAAEWDLPVILHVRRTADLLLKGLRRIRVRGGIVHAFNGSDQQAMAFIDLGFRLGFGGAMTFERALQIRRLAAALPLEAIVLETDAPDIPPQWHYRTAAERAAGHRARNEPAELPRMAEVLAMLRRTSVDTIRASTAAAARAALPALAGLMTPAASDAPAAAPG
jgi:TatD DNase family protein